MNVSEDVVLPVTEYGLIKGFGVRCFSYLAETEV